jgi:hypothetical protein
MSGEAWNFTVAEAGIVDRLKVATQQGPAKWAREVGTRADMARVAEEQQNAPCLYVVYDGYVVQTADEYACQLLHRFLVVVVVKNAAAQREVSAIDADAGAKMKSVLQALHGFKPPACTSKLVPTTPPRPYHSAGFAYFPLAFAVESNHCVPNPY